MKGTHNWLTINYMYLRYNFIYLFIDSYIHSFIFGPGNWTQGLHSGIHPCPFFIFRQGLAELLWSWAGLKLSILLSHPPRVLELIGMNHHTRPEGQLTVTTSVHVHKNHHPDQDNEHICCSQNYLVPHYEASSPLIPPISLAGADYFHLLKIIFIF